jgi:hypothetical protein
MVFELDIVCFIGFLERWLCVWIFHSIWKQKFLEGFYVVPKVLCMISIFIKFFWQLGTTYVNKFEYLYPKGGVMLCHQHT